MDLHSTRRTFLLGLVSAAVLTVSAAVQSPSFLWKVSNAHGSLYLVGSVHMLTSDYYPLSPALEAAYVESGLLVEELDLSEMLAPASQMAVLSRGQLPSGQSLRSTVSPDTYEQVARHASALGLPMEPLNRFKPWSLALTLLGMAWQQAGFDAELGLDRHFYERARRDNKPVQGLETVEFQIARFDDMPPADQDRLLRQSIREIESETQAVTTLVNAWKSGDAATVERIVLADVKDDPLMYRRLIVERNQTWFPKLEALVTRSRPALVVVGAAHLVGPDGLLALFRAKGFSLEQR